MKRFPKPAPPKAEPSGDSAKPSSASGSKPEGPPASHPSDKAETPHGEPQHHFQAHAQAHAQAQAPPPAADSSASSAKTKKLEKELEEAKKTVEQQKEKITKLEEDLEERTNTLNETEQKLDQEVKSHKSVVKRIEKDKSILQGQNAALEKENAKLKEELAEAIQAESAKRDAFKDRKQMERELSQARTNRNLMAEAMLTVFNEYVKICLKIFNEEPVQNCDCEAMSRTRYKIEEVLGRTDDKPSATEKPRRQVAEAMCKELQDKINDLNHGSGIPIFSISKAAGTISSPSSQRIAHSQPSLLRILHFYG